MMALTLSQLSRVLAAVTMLHEGKLRSGMQQIGLIEGFTTPSVLQPRAAALYYLLMERSPEEVPVDIRHPMRVMNSVSRALRRDGSVPWATQALSVSGTTPAEVFLFVVVYELVLYDLEHGNLEAVDAEGNERKNLFTVLQERMKEIGLIT